MRHVLVVSIALTLALAGCSKSEPAPALDVKKATPEAATRAPVPSEVPDDPNLNRIDVTSVSEGSKVTLRSGTKVFEGATPATLWVPDGDYVLRVEDEGDVWETFVEGVASDRKLEVPVGGSPSLIVGERKVAVGKDLLFVPIDAEDGLDFRPLAAKAEATGKEPPFLANRNGTAIDSIVVHATTTAGAAKEAFDNDAKEALSCHFYIERNGLVYQALDLAALAIHAGEANSRSICVAFVHPLPNLLDDGVAPQSTGDMNADYAPAREYTVNGAPVKTFGLTPAQEEAWDKLVLTLLRAFPDLVGRFPNKDGAVILGARPDSLPGIIAHLHIAEDRWDIPSLDFDRLKRLLVAANRWRP